MIELNSIDECALLCHDLGRNFIEPNILLNLKPKYLYSVFATARFLYVLQIFS